MNRMRLLIKTLIVVALLSLTTGCSYEFSDDSFKDIQTDNPNLNITLNGFIDGEETSSSKLIQYAITGTGNDTFEMIVAVDGLEVHRSQERTGDFYLAVEDLENGQHSLSIEFAYPTNSGSLADAVGAEIFVGRAEYSFILDKSLADAFGIAAVNIVQGSIYVTLNPITDPNFDEAYLVIKNEFGNILEERRISQEDLTDLEIHDDQTVSYDPSYAIKIKNSFAEDTSEFVMLPTPRMTFSITPLLYRSFEITNNAHPLYGNFDTIGFDYTYPNTGSSFHDLNPQGGTTTINYGFRFGDTFYVNFKIFKNNSQVGNLNEQLQVGGNLPITNFEDMTYISSLNKYFIVDVSNSNELIIYKLNGDSFAIENSQTLTNLNAVSYFKSLDVDPVTGNLIINLNKKAIVFNPSSFSTLNTYNAVDFNADHSSADVYYRGDYIILEDPWSSGAVFIYEKTTGIQKFSINKTTKFFSAKDASFFYANGGLYKLLAGNFVFLNAIQDSQNNTVAPPLDHMTFDKISNSAVFGWYRTTFYLDLSNYNQTYISDTEIVYDVKYTDDGRPFINCNHFSAGNKSHLYDINSNSTKLIDTYYQQSYRYFNGHIFSPSGFYLESNLYTN